MDSDINAASERMDKIFKNRWENKTTEHIRKTSETVNSFLEKYNQGLSIDRSANDREWMQFDNAFKLLMDHLSQIATYDSLLKDVCESVSLEQLDAAMMCENVDLQVKAKTAWNAWLNEHINIFNSRLDADVWLDKYQKINF